MACPCRTAKFYQAAQTINLSTLSKSETVSSSDKLTHNGGSLRQGRIADDFLSSRKAARTERCTPKPSAAGLDRKLKLPTALDFYKRVKRIFLPRPVSNILYKVET
jgi:hypothetical protein